jgi:hypothetical protein
MVKFTTSDKLEILSACEKEQTVQTVLTFTESYNCKFGDILRIVEKSGNTTLAGRLRAEIKQSQIEANERSKAKRTDERRNKKLRKTEGFWKLPSVTSKSIELKVTPEQDKVLYTHYLEYRSMANFVKEGEARRKEEKQPYDYVKRYRMKNQSCSAHWLGGCVLTLTSTIIPTGVRGIYLGRIAFPVRGKISPNTSGSDIEVAKKNDKYFLKFADKEIEILYQDHDEYYRMGIKETLHESWDKGVFYGGWILRAKNGKWFFKCGIPRESSKYEWDETSKKIVMVIQPTFNELGIVWNAEYFNEDNQRVFRATLLHAISTPRITSKKKDCRSCHVSSAIKKLFRIWHERFSQYRPIVVLQETVGKAPSQESANMNPTYKFELKLQDKLAELNGMGANIGDVEPFNIDKIRARLSI